MATLLKKIKRAITFVLIIIAIVILIFAVMAIGGPGVILPLIGGSFTALQLSLIAFLIIGAAFLISRRDAKEFTDRVFEGFKSGANHTADIIGSTLGSFAKGLLSNFIPVIVVGTAGYIGYKTYESNRQEKEKINVSTE